MAAIGSLFIEIGARAANLDSGLRQVEAKLKGFGEKAGRFLTLPARGLGMPGAMASGFLGPVAGALNSVPFVGGALSSLAGGQGGFTANIQKGMQEIVELDRMSKRLSVSTETLAGIQFMAGSTSDDAARAMFHLSHEIGSAAAGSKQAGEKFAALGLDAEELAHVPLDQAFGRVADKIRSLPPGAEQAAAAFELFGKRGEALMPLLLRGSEGLAQAVEKAKLLGLAVSPIDADNVRRASLAIREIQGMAEGVFRQAAIGIAPYLESLGNVFHQAIEKAGGVEPLMSKLFDKIAEGVILVVGVLQELAVGLKDIFATAHDVQEAKKNPARAGARAMGLDSAWGRLMLGQLLPAGLGEKLFDAHRRGAAMIPADQRWDKQLRDWFAQVKAGAFGSGGVPTGPGMEVMKLGADVAALNEELRKHTANIGKSALETKLWELAQRGASDALLQQTRNLADIDRMEELRHKHRSEAAKLAEDLAGLNKVAGGLSDETYGGAVLDLYHDYASKLGMGKHQLAGAAEAGSGEAQSLINRNFAGQREQDPVVKLQQLLDLLRVQGEARAREAREIADAIRSGRITFQPQGV